MTEEQQEEIRIAYINYHSPWIIEERKEYYRKEIERLCNKYYK